VSDRPRSISFVGQPQCGRGWRLRYCKLELSHPVEDILTDPDVLCIRGHILQDPLDCAQVMRYGRTLACGSGGWHDCWNSPNLGRFLPQRIRTPRASTLVTIMTAALCPMIQNQIVGPTSGFSLRFNSHFCNDENDRSEVC